MTNARVNEALNAKKPKDRHGFKTSPTIKNALIKLKNIEKYVAFEDLSGNSFIQGVPLILALCLSDPKILENSKLSFLFASCTDANVRLPDAMQKDYGMTSLDCLLDRRKMDIAVQYVKLAKEKGLTIDAAELNNYGFSLLHLAVLLQAPQLIEALGQDVVAALNIQDHFGRTPLHYAYFLADRELIQMLERLGADVDIQDNHGSVPNGFLKTSISVVNTFLKDQLNSIFAEQEIGEMLEQIKQNRIKLIFAPINPQEVESKGISVPGNRA